MIQRRSHTPFTYKRFILLLLLAIMPVTLAACSSQQELDQAVASAFQTQVALGVEAAHMTQTAIAEQIQQTVTAEYALTPSPTNTFTPTETELPTLTPTLAQSHANRDHLPLTRNGAPTLESSQRIQSFIISL